MSYDQKGKYLQVHPHSFVAEGRFWEQPASSAPQDAQFTQAIESFDELAPLVQYVRYNYDNNPHQSDWWADTTNTSDGKFNENDNYNICTAIAACDTCSTIKDIWFLDREDVTADDLEAQAYAIHAIWEKDDDDRLRESGVHPDASDEDLSRLK